MAYLRLHDHFPFVVYGQHHDSRVSSVPGSITNSDPVTIYQCVAIDSAGKIIRKGLARQPRLSTVTRKYILRKDSLSYTVTCFTTTIHDFPNRKFSGLKISERPYWEFAQSSKHNVTNEQARQIKALIASGHEAIEFDYPVSRHTVNQVIVKNKKDFRQLVLDNDKTVESILVP
jgi:hypothetical protein